MDYFRINSSKGGISKWGNIESPKGSFKFGSNLDIRKETDSISCGFDLTDDLAVGTLDGLVLFIVNSSDGNSYHFTNTGKIYKRTSAGAYTLVYTDTGAIKGAGEWGQNNGKFYLFWATDDKLHSKEIAGLANWSDVDATIGSTTYPKTITSADWHTMKRINGNMYFCNGNTIGMVAYDTSYTDDALVLTPDNEAKSLMEYKGYAYIGGVRNTSSLNAMNAMVVGEFPLVQIGENGQVILADITKNNVPLFSFPDGGKVNPDAVESEEDNADLFVWDAINSLNWNVKSTVSSLAYFGVFGNGTGKTGVYTYGRKKSDADPVLNLEYQLECSEIGSVRKVGTDFLISYTNVAGTGFGVKKLSTNRAVGTYESFEYPLPVSLKESVLNMIRLVTAPMPSGTSIKCYRRMNKSGEFILCNLEGGGNSFETGQEAIFLVGDSGKVAEVKLILYPSGTNTPEVLEIIGLYD